LVLASTVPACQAYDPAFAYEMATVVKHGLKRMYGPQPEDVFYYLTLYNENYAMPPMPNDVEAGIMAGLYKWADAPEGPATRATVLFSGSAHGAARAAADELAGEWDVGVELWSATSYKTLREEALSTERWSRLHPSEPARLPLVAQLLADAEGPIVAVTDFMKVVPEQIARFVARPFVPLGTDGVGRSDTREALRRYFEVDAPHVVVAVLSALAATGDVKPEVVRDAIAHYDIDPDTADPGRV
jgi:pyruvate dehydrogenase E1 component